MKLQLNPHEPVEGKVKLPETIAEKGSLCIGKDTPAALIV